MKSKILCQVGLICLISICIATPAFARLERCTEANGGVLFQGGNGQSYCISRRRMNWWSAFSWCKGVSGDLVPVETACPGTGFASCTNIGGKQNKITNQYMWSGTPSSTLSAYVINTDGATNTAYRSDNSKTALCY